MKITKCKTIKTPTPINYRIYLINTIRIGNMDLLFKTLGEAQVMAPRSATLTWINDQVGASVSQGSNLAILSDLSSFKVEGEIADSYAD